MPVCLCQAAQPVLSTRALWLRSGPSPHVIPALPQPQASLPTPRARSPGFGDHGAWVPPGRRRSRLTNEPSPHPHPSREAVTLPAGEEKEATSEHSDTASVPRRKRTRCPRAAQKGPLLDGEGVGRLSVGGVAAGRQDAPSPKEAEGPSRQCSLGGLFGRGRGISGALVG